MLRRCFIGLFAVLLLSLCVPVFAAVPAIVKSNVRVLPAAAISSAGVQTAGVRMMETAPGRLSLSGAVPKLKAGDVIVSGAGEGTLRKVVSVGKSGAQTTVQTAQAALTDVFQEADIKLKKPLGVGDFTTLTPLMPGVSIAQKPQVRLNSAAANSVFSLDPIQCNFLQLKLCAQSGGCSTGQVTVDGTASLTPQIDIDLAIRKSLLPPFAQVTRARFVPQLQASLNVTVQGNANVTFVNRSWPIAHFGGKPITVNVGGVPVVFTPTILITLKLSGDMKAQAQLVATATLTAGAGVDYHVDSDNSTHLDPVVFASPSFAFRASAGATFSVDLSPLHTNFDLKIYGIAGPYMDFDCPIIHGEIDFTALPAPGELCVNASALFRGTGGFKVDIFGIVKEDYALKDDVLRVGPFTMLDKCYGEAHPGDPLPTPNPTPTPLPPPPLARLEIVPSSPSVYTGDVKQLSANAYDTNNNLVALPDNAFTWTSSNTAIATIGATSGVATAVAAGVCTITVRENRSGLNRSGTTILRVTPGPNVVTNTGDSGSHSLREAINYANIVPNTTITFNIPNTDPGFAFGVFTINDSSLPAISQNTTIDGSTQTTFTGNTNANGPEVTINGTLGLDTATATLKNLTYNWKGGTLTGNNTLNVDSTAFVTWSSGSLTGDSISVNGTINWNGGFLYGTLNIPSGGTLNFNSASQWAARIVGGTLNNAGNLLFAPNSALLFQGIDTGIDTQEAKLNNSGTCTMQAQILDGNGTFANTGTLNKIGSGSSQINNVAVTNSGTINSNAGYLTLNNFKQTAGSTNLVGGDLGGTLNILGGALTGAGTISGSVVNKGTVKPGNNGAGLLTINGDYTQGSVGILEVQLGGTTAGTQFDQLAVTGKASLIGTLKATLINGFTPSATDIFKVIACGSRAGSFTTVNTPNLGAKALTTVYKQTEVDLTTQQFSIGITNITLAEGNSATKNAVFTVTLSAARTQSVTVNYATANGTTNPAMAGSDYTAKSGTLTFAPGETTKTISIPIVGDTIYEGDETFFLNLSNVANAVIANAQGIGTITDDDDSTAPTVSFTTSATAPTGTTPISGSTIYNVMPAITGVAADTQSGVAKVSLRLYRATGTTGVYEYWMGSGWTTTLTNLNTVLSPAAGGANVTWSKSSGWPLGGNFSDGTYYLRALAYDKSGNSAVTLASNFKKATDTTAPTISFTTSATTPVGTTPTSGGTVSGAMPIITGVAADSGSGVTKVEVRLYRTGTGGAYEYWTGSVWTTTITGLSATLNPATGGTNVTWSKNSGWPSGAAFADGTYYLRAVAYDKAGSSVVSLASSFKKVTSAQQGADSEPQIFEDAPSE